MRRPNGTLSNVLPALLAGIVLFGQLCFELHPFEDAHGPEEHVCAFCLAADAGHGSTSALALAATLPPAPRPSAVAPGMTHHRSPWPSPPTRAPPVAPARS